MKEVGAKILIAGLSNSGKSTLLKTLKDALVVSRDGKPFSLKIPHFNVPDYNSIEELMSMVDQKCSAYSKKNGKRPATIAFDSVSRIFTDIENYCSKKHTGYSVWSNVNNEVNEFVQNINQIVSYGINVVLIAHVMWDDKAGKFIETCKGSFKNIGGFMSTVDYAVNIDVRGSSYEVQLFGNSLSRTLIEGLPQRQPADEFSLQGYIETIKKRAQEVKNEYEL